jgi:fatty-acid desaturase
MEVNMVGIAINIAFPVIVLARQLSPQQLKAFLTLLAMSYAASLTGRKTIYCVVVVPTFMTSLLLAFAALGHDSTSPRIYLALLASLLIAVAKVNICMSVCLHRYAAHSAFKAGPITNIFLILLGCLANQGGPVWWASQHRCHHKHCDVDRDPHSPLLDGTEAAFAFFETHTEIEEEFLPNHLNCQPGDGISAVFMRIVDTWSWLAVFAELSASLYLFGLDGLFISYTSGWLCQSITLWFNVVNHPPDGKINDTNTTQTPKKKAGVTDECKATNGKETVFQDYYLPFRFLDTLYPFFAKFVKETEHEHHHNHARLAKRSKYDIAYWGFVWPLEQLGLVWNVIV